MATPQPRPTFRLELRVLGERITVEGPRPEAPVRLDEVLPLLREIDDRAVDVAVRRTEASGESVSCRKGCSACCRAQPVPVTPAEAYALWRLVEALPEPRRAETRERFADRVRRLRAAGLAAPFLYRDPELTPEQARATAQSYFRLGLVCPFLEDDACGIYPDRPFVCRQYLVTSPAELCRDPFTNPVRPIPLPIAAAGAALQTAEEMLGTPQHTVPLVLALEYAQAHRAELERTYDASTLYPRAVRALVSRPTDKHDEAIAT
jgi:Fe-S-cluster containining protein